MNAAAIEKRVNAVLKRVNGTTQRQLYVRTYVAASDADELIGRGTSSAFTDILVDPPPVVTSLDKRQVMYLSSTGVKATADDYQITFSALSVSEETLKDPTSQFVLKDTDGGVEILELIFFNGPAYQSTTVLWVAYARSKSSV